MLSGSHCVTHCLVFTQLLSVSEVPDDWKRAVVVPVFKKGAAVSDISNYRPISLTCIVSKIMERIISRQIFDHLLVNNLLHREQYGFFRGRLQSAYRRGHTVETALIKIFNDLLQAADKGHVSALCLLTAAFDTVDHEVLIS